MGQRSLYLGLLVTRTNVLVLRWSFAEGRFALSPALATAELLGYANLGPPFDGNAQFEQQVRYSDLVRTACGSWGS